jgi:hypothetical protein
MNSAGTTTNNSAETGATIGIQASEVHNSTIYQTLPDTPPKEKFEVGVRFLDDGMPGRAYDLISEAIAHEYDTAEVRFHWVLAILSKRSLRDLTAEERQRLAQIPQFLCRYASDEWRRALAAICALLDCLNDTQADGEPALTELLALGSRQRYKIIRHLDLVLTGGVKDHLWSQTRRHAEDARFDDDRRGRVWAYFHANPSPPRTRQPAAPVTTRRDNRQAVGWSALFVTAVGSLGWLVLAHATPLPILAYLLALAAAYVAATNGLEWRYRTERLARMERDHATPSGIHQAPDAGFANRVDHSFMYYTSKYAPKNRDNGAWQSETAGVRRMLRDEVVELYRESRTKVESVNWLIGHMVLDVRQRWLNGTLWEYRERYRTQPATKARCALALAVLAAATVTVVGAAVQTDPLPATGAVLVMVIGGRFAALGRLRIIGERRRYNEECLEYERVSAQREEAYRRWKTRLESTRPSENEMESWLDCDKTLFLDLALRHYQLAWRDIIAHAVLQTPAKPYKRARVRGGSWRYSRYDIRLFLITQDGVREVSTELDFEHVAFNGQERNNFRFDAVSSVHVAETDQLSYTLELTLTNGPVRNIRVVDPDDQQPDPVENSRTLSRVNLDAAGFTHALHILEGIAAEGRNWIDRVPPAATDNTLAQQSG